MIKVNIHEFKEMLNRISPAASKDGVVRFEAKRDAFSAHLSDGFCAVATIISCESEKQEEFFVMYDAIKSVVTEFSKLPSDNSEATLIVSNVLTVQMEDASAAIPLMTVSDCKTFSKPDTGEAHSVVVDSHWLKKCLRSAIERVDPTASGMRGNVYLRFCKDSFEAGGSGGVEMSLVQQATYLDASKLNIGDGYLDVALTAQRANSLIAVLEENKGIIVNIYKKSIMLMYDTNIFVIPMAENDAEWKFRDKVSGLMQNISAGGTTYELDRKALIMALNLIGCNINKSAKDDWVVAFEYSKDALIVSNMYGTAKKEVAYGAVDGSFEGKLYFSIERLKKILNYLEGENVLLTLTVAGNGGSYVHFEEATEQIILCGIVHN